MNLKLTISWTSLCVLLLGTTIVPFAFAPFGGYLIQTTIFTGDDVANKIMNGLVVGAYNGSITSFYFLLFMIWLVGFFLINPLLGEEIKQWIRRRVA